MQCIPRWTFFWRWSAVSKEAGLFKAGVSSCPPPAFERTSCTGCWPKIIYACGWHYIQMYDTNNCTTSLGTYQCARFAAVAWRLHHTRCSSCQVSSNKYHLSIEIGRAGMYYCVSTLIDQETELSIVVWHYVPGCILFWGGAALADGYCLVWTGVSSGMDERPKSMWHVTILGRFKK